MSSPHPHSFHDKGPSLSAVLAGSSTWEHALAPIGPAARIAFAAVTGLVTCVAGVTMFARPWLQEHSNSSSLWFGNQWIHDLVHYADSIRGLYTALAVLLIAFCALTEGFALAGRRLQTGLAGLVGLTMIALVPPAAIALVVVANLVAVVAVGALVLAGLVMLLFGILDS